MAVIHTAAGMPAVVLRSLSEKTGEPNCIDRTYAVARISAFSPAAAWYFLLYLYFVFALVERKNEIQKKKKVPLCRRRDRRLRKSWY